MVDALGEKMEEKNKKCEDVKRFTNDPRFVKSYRDILAGCTIPKDTITSKRASWILSMQVLS